MKFRKQFKTNPSLKSKIFIFVLTVIFFFFFMAVCTFISNQMIAENIYHTSKEEFLSKHYDPLILEDSQQLLKYLHQSQDAAEFCEQKNFASVKVWTNDPDYPNTLRYNWNWTSEHDASGLTIQHAWRKIGIDYHLWDGKVDPNSNADIFVEITVSQSDKLVHDDYWDTYQFVSAIYFWRFLIYFVALVLLLLGLCGFVSLMCVSGRHREEPFLRSGWGTFIPLDILTTASGAVLIWLIWDLHQNSFSYVRTTLEWVLLELVVLGWSMSLALRIKLGTWKENILLLKWMLRLRRVVFSPLGKKLLPKIIFAWTQIKNFIKKIPFPVKTGIIIFVFLLIEFVILRYSLKRYIYNDIILFWLVEKAIIIPVVFYFVMNLRKLKESGKALASGDLSHTTNTRFMIGDFKEHGKNLNSIANGMSIAVEERLKSERMKTELITNVTHDIKTPLTSIINYADLLKKEVGDKTVDTLTSDNTDCTKTISIDFEKFAKIQEYSSVLHRHSERLKRLIEDLLEASKAATGNLDVYLEPCEAAIMLTQATGEYEQRLESAGLTIVTKQPEQPISIMADGRRLWRIFDNLLNNICKYAQAGTRVYLTLEEVNDFAVITFKNISRDALDISTDELMERFVRGDASRHTEGNGLGLSIAKSLTELQKGTMELCIDGDLFKVTLRFPIHKMET